MPASPFTLQEVPQTPPDTHFGQATGAAVGSNAAHTQINKSIYEEKEPYNSSLSPQGPSDASNPDPPHEDPAGTTPSKQCTNSDPP